MIQQGRNSGNGFIAAGKEKISLVNIAEKISPRHAVLKEP